VTDWRIGVAVDDPWLAEVPRVYLDCDPLGSAIDGTRSLAAAPAVWAYVDHTWAPRRHLILHRFQQPFKEVGRD